MDTLTAQSNPHTTEAELGILGCIVTDPALVLPRLVEAGVSARWFHDIRHRHWYQMFSAMHRDGKAIDGLSAKSELRTHPSKGEFGGIEYFSTIADSITSAHAWRTYLEPLRDAFNRRRAIEAAQVVIEHASNPTIPAARLLDDLKEAVESIYPAVNPLPPIIDGDEFVKEELPELKEIIHGVIHQGSKAAIGGGSKACKTWTMLDLGLSVAAGVPWLAYNTTQGKVLYVNFEIQQKPWQNRLRAVAAAKGIDVPKDFKIQNLRGYAADYRTLLPKIRELVKGMELVLIILDPTYKLYGSGTDENAARDIAALLNGFEELASNTGAAIVFAAHFSKGNQSGKQSIDRISGSGVFARDADSLIVMTELEAESCFGIECILRNFKRVQPFSVRWEYPLMKLAPDVDPANLRQAAGRSRDPKHEPFKLLAAIGHTTPDNPISITAWATSADVHRQTLNDHLTEMRESGWIGTVGEGNSARRFITNKGKALLASKVKEAA